MEHPVLSTRRLRLRGLALTDAADVQRLAGDRDIAANTAIIPHPYEDGVAEKWITDVAKAFEEGRRVNFAVTLAVSGEFMGSVGLGFEAEHNRAVLGYWFGKPYWNQGYASEAARAVVEYAFRERGVHRVYAHHLSRNPASGRVLQKIGMAYEGTLRHDVIKWGVHEDVVIYGMLAEDLDKP